MMHFFGKKEPATPSHPGTVQCLSGRDAAFLIEASCNAACFVHDVPQWTVAESHQSAPDWQRVDKNLEKLSAHAAAHALIGGRTALMCGAAHGLHDVLLAAGARGVPLVVHLAAMAPAQAAQALHGGHADYVSLGSSSALQLFTTNAQETADLSLIARYAAEYALLPVVCGLDVYETSHAVRPVSVPDAELLRAYIGSADDVIESATEGQCLVYGPQRRRVPLRVDPDAPAGIGGYMNADAYGLAAAGFRFFGAHHAVEALTRAMTLFGDMTGRQYDLIETYRADDADAVVIAQGSIIERLKPVVDYLRKEKRLKAGLINLRVYRPFPGAALSHALLGKKAVTVLERTDQPLSESLPLTADVRGTLDKATENGMADAGHPPFAAYASYSRRGNRPSVHSGAYGVGGALPSFDECCAVFENMAHGATRKRFFILTRGLEKAPHNFPHLQQLQQTLNRSYHEIAEVTLPVPVRALPEPTNPTATVGVYAHGTQGGLFATNRLAKAVSNCLGRSFVTHPEGGLDNTARAAWMVMAPHAETPLPFEEVVHTALVGSWELLNDETLHKRVARGGTLIVATADATFDLAKSLPPSAARWISREQLHVWQVGAGAVASAAGPSFAYLDQLALWSLFGAYIRFGGAFDSADLEAIIDSIRRSLEHEGTSKTVVDRLLQAIHFGADNAVKLPADKLAARAKEAETEHPAPWTVEVLSDAPPTAFDGNRFWRSVGYLEATGRSDEALCDPYVASGIIPARSSAYHDATPVRLAQPRWLPERCTGCGMCWAACPESALAPAVFPIAALFNEALTRAGKAGPPLVQIPRLKDALLRTAQKEFARDGLGRFITAEALFDAAFEMVSAKLELDADKKDALVAEFSRVRDAVAGFSVARTATFFDDPEGAAKGTGVVLSIALNTANCTACRICVAECPEEAFEWVQANESDNARLKKQWQLQMSLPSPSRSALAMYTAVDGGAVHHLLDRETYHCMVGGDGSYPGNAAKTALHLVGAGFESVMRDRYAAHVARLDEAIQRLESAIQGDVAEAVHINDFDAFAQQLSRLESGHTDAEALAHLVQESGPKTAVDEQRLKTLAAALSSLKAQRQRYTKGSDGSGRARQAMVFASRRILVWAGAYPRNPFAFPWFGETGGQGQAAALGLFDGLVQLTARDWAEWQFAEEVLAGKRDAQLRYDATTWEALPERFRQLVPRVWIADMGGNFDSNGGERPITLVSIVDDPFVGVPNGAFEGAHCIQSSVAHGAHLIDAVRTCVSDGKPGWFRIYAPDPYVSGVAPHEVITQARRAVESRAFPLLHRAPDGSLTLQGNPDEDADWTAWTQKVQLPSGVEQAFDAPLTVADWAVHEGRYAKYFELVSTGEIGQDMVTLTDYFAMQAADRDGRKAYIRVAGARGRAMAAIVSPAMIALCEDKLAEWRALREEKRSAATAPASGKDSAHEMDSPGAVDPLLQERLAERLLALCGYDDDPAFFKRSLREFVAGLPDDGGNDA